MKVLYLDTETTGVDHRTNEITQIALIVEIDGEVKEEVNFRCQPTNWDAIDPKAIETTGVSIEQLKTFELPGETAKKIQALFNRYIDKFDKSDKFYPAGHNVTFDLEFLQAFWKKHLDSYGTGSYQNWRALDTRTLANFMAYKGIIQPSDLKLKTLCDLFHVTIQAHDAMSDIRATRELMNKMLLSLQVP